MATQQIVVVFDIEGETREHAAKALVGGLAASDVLGFYRVEGHELHVAVESWWLAEGDLKHIDRNDNPAMRLVHVDDADGCCAECPQREGDYCSSCGAFVEDPHRDGCERVDE